MSDTSIELILCDVGGVLGSNGWDHGERASAAKHFKFDYSDFEKRHEEAVDTWECGRMTMDEYLDFTIFNIDRGFSREDFTAFMFAQSVPNISALQLMASLASQHRWRMMTMNNESAELNAHRITLFGMESTFSAFLTSAYIGAQKPHERFYDSALAISHADPARTVFIDDRPANLEPARARGVHCIQASDTNAVRAGLAALGITT
ncbi:MAG TPA: HAD-IA family hydrolase [Gemmatimonadaceae bacterium]